MKARLWIITPLCKMAVRSPMSGIWRVPSPCLPIILVNALLVVQLKVTFSYHTFSEEDTLYSAFSLEIKSFDIETRFLAHDRSSIFCFRTIYVSKEDSRIWRGMPFIVSLASCIAQTCTSVRIVGIGCVNELIACSQRSLLALLAYIKIACWAVLLWKTGSWDRLKIGQITLCL